MPGRRAQETGQLGTTRRAVLRAGLGLSAVGATGLLAGCRLRLQDDAPDVPVVDSVLQRASIPDQAALIAAYQRVGALAVAARSATGAAAAQPALLAALATAHRAQADVLRETLSSRGVPGGVYDGPASGSPSASGAPGASPTGAPGASPTGSPSGVLPLPTAAAMSVGSFAAAEGQALAVLSPAQLAAATATNRLLLVSVTTAQLIAADALGAPLAIPVLPAGGADSALPVLAATREAVYAFEVIAARLTGADKAAAQATLTALRARRERLLTVLGSTAPSDPLGYRLPAISDATSARTVAATVLGAQLDTGLSGLDASAGDAGATCRLIAWQVEAAAMLRSWGGAPRTFPGMAWTHQ